MKPLLKILTVMIFLLQNGIAYSQADFTSSSLPIIIIDTGGKTIPDNPKIDAHMGMIDNGSGKRNYITDSFNGYDGKIGIEIRGHSSQMFDKKQYSIETRSAAGADSNVSLLGLPKESDWVLNASFIDKSFLRNVLAYKLSNDIGRYASRTRYCETFLNGEYLGIYILQEKVKRDKNRVNIEKIEPDDIAGDSLTGGYIVHIDRKEYGEKYWVSPFAPIKGGNGKVYYLLEYPDPADITTEQFDYIKNYISFFETIMNALKYNDPISGYYNYIDVDSFVDTFLLNEFAKNTDSYRLSAYLYKDRNEKLCMGPIWDFDISFGMADYDQGYDPNGWQSYKQSDGDISNPFWVIKLMQDPVFKNKLAKRWNELKKTVFDYGTIVKFIDSTTTKIEEARIRNFNKWKIIGTYVWPNYFVGKTYQEEISYMKNWISRRYNWLDANISLQYSDVEWNEKNFSSESFELGREKKFHVSEFFNSKFNIDTVEFKSLSLDIKINVTADTVSIIIHKPGTYTFKGIGKKSGWTLAVSPAYVIDAATVSVDERQAAPTDFVLHQNYPNPFNPATTIEFRVPSFAFVSLKVFDMLGREVITLVDEYKQAGTHSVQLSTNDYQLSSGIYFYKLTSGAFSLTRKMLFLK
ncbi:MAG: CotH kinase family protein [Ignavibacteriales bacterium]|nr:CotH kinase family protein [Ignavibacteriales bacterium]